MSVSLPPGSAVSLHSCPTARDCGRASGQRLRPRGPFPAPPDAFGAAVRRLKGGFVDVASVSGIAGQSLRGFFKGWLRNEARDPVLLILVLAPWCGISGKELSSSKTREFPEPDRLNLRESPEPDRLNLREEVFQKLDSLGEELDQRGRTSEEGPACGGGACSRAEAAGANQGGGACGGSGAP